MIPAADALEEIFSDWSAPPPLPGDERPDRPMSLLDRFPEDPAIAELTGPNSWSLPRAAAPVSSPPTARARTGSSPPMTPAIPRQFEPSPLPPFRSTVVTRARAMHWLPLGLVMSRRARLLALGATCGLGILASIVRQRPTASVASGSVAAAVAPPHATMARRGADTPIRHHPRHQGRAATPGGYDRGIRQRARPTRPRARHPPTATTRHATPAPRAPPPTNMPASTVSRPAPSHPSAAAIAAGEFNIHP